MTRTVRSEVLTLQAQLDQSSNERAQVAQSLAQQQLELADTKARLSDNDC